MEYFSFAYLLEYLLVVLFIVGIIYMSTINKKLKMLKSGGDGFKAVVVELNHATDNAKNAIQGLKLTVRDAEHGLDGNLKQARSVTEELKYLIGQAGGHSENLQQNPRNIPQPSENLRNIRPPTVPQNKAKNFADTTLEKVAMRHQNLPNPIVHSQEKRPMPPQSGAYAEDMAQNTGAAQNSGLGLNIPAEHREMALQRREQALKSIAAKKSQQNRRPPQNGQRQNPNVPNPNVPNPNQPMRQRQAPQNRPNQVPNHLTQRPRPEAAPQPQNLGAEMQPQPSRPSPKLSLSEMVGRHAELERNSFGNNEPTEAVETNPERGAADKRQSLFQKLSRTR